MTGHLIFDAAGNLVNQTAYTYGGNETDMGDNNQYTGNPADLSSWQSTRFSSNGLPVFTANFTGQPLANTVNETTTNGKSQAQDYIIELDLGLRNLGGKDGDWSVEGGQSLADIQVQTTETTEQVYKAAPVEKYLYEDRQATDADAYYYQTEKGWFPVNVVTVNGKQTITYQDGTKQDPATGTDVPNIVTVDEANPRLSTMSWIEAGTKTVDAFFAADFKPDKDARYYIMQLADGNGPFSEPKKVMIEQDVNGGWQTGDGTPITSADFQGNPSKYETKIHVEKKKYTATPGEPVIDDTLKENVLYRTADGKYDNAYEKVGNDWQLKSAAKNQPLYIEGTELVTKTTVNFNDVATFANAERMENATKAGNKSFITQDAGQNGYASGILSSTNITNDGVVYGYYDNGQTIPLYQIALYDFHNHQGLRREGGNLYAQTKESGEARQGVAGEAGFGVTRAYNIEMSNVDLSREFVNMITTQRGFQANSKGVTTVDTMLETVIGMKR